MANSENLLDIDTGAVVCNGANLIGQVKIGAKTVVHPKATLDGSTAPILIGQNNIIEENVVIRGTGTGTETGTGTMEIGSNNSFKVGTHCHARKVGNNNIFEVKSYVGEGVTISNECTIGPKCRVEGEQVVPDKAILLVGHVPYTMNHGSNSNSAQIELLTKNLPNYHKLMRSK